MHALVGTAKRSRHLFAAVSLGLALFLVASPVAADSHSGTVGHYSITDTVSKAGVTCNYTDAYPTHYLVSVSVPAPKAFWPNSSAVASGTVGWWAVVQRYGGTGWMTVKTGATQKATATKTTAAAFTKRTTKYASPNDKQHRVVIHIVWYRAEGGTLGGATHTVVHYREQYAGWSRNKTGYCFGAETILT
jgi:hypothetical protein